MAQRYGRKRKRAHLARIAELERATSQEIAARQAAARRAADLDAEMQSWDQEIRRLFGEHSAIRRETPVVRSRQPIREMPIMQDVSPRFYPDGPILSETMATRERMRRFIFGTDHDRFEMRRNIRFVEQDGSGGVAYCLSEEMLLHRRGFGEREAEYLARQIANDLVGHFNRYQQRESA